METVTTLTMNPTLDVSAMVERLTPDQKLRGSSRRYYPGGGGVNVARAIVRYGGTARAVFPAGGATGEKLVALLQAEGVADYPIPIAADTRENFVVHVDSSGELYHFVMPGPLLNAAEIQHCLTMLEQLRPTPRYLVASGSLPPGVDEEFYARIARFAHQHNTRLILDTSGPPLQAALREGVYLIKPNQREFADLAGHALAADPNQRLEQVKALAARGHAEVLIVTLGSEGALLATADQQIWARPPRLEGVSPVGAGDSFVGLLTLKLAHERPLKEALCYGVAAAAAAVLTRGAELFRAEDVDRLYAAMAKDETAIQVVRDS
jgi:6-phosphofructokinase 2